MAQLSFMNAFLKGREVQFDHDSEFMWQEDAACRFQPWSLFEIASSDDKIAEGIVPDGDDPQNALTDLNAANFEKANQICGTCPVIAECYSSGTPDDFAYTFRAGVMPTKFNPTLAGRPSKGAVSKVPKVSLIHGAVPGGKYCGQGHNEWSTYADGSRRCKACKRDNARLKTVDRRKSDRRLSVDVGKDCTKCGESNWRKRKDNDSHFCQTCKGRANEANRRKKKGIADDPFKPCHKGHMEWVPRMYNGKVIYQCTPCKEARAKMAA